MKTSYRSFNENIKAIRDYYALLVEETKEHRLVGSTNEWVLDNYYVVSEQEKLLHEELQSSELKHIGRSRLEQIEQMLDGYLHRCHFQVDKPLMLRYLHQVQSLSKDYLSYPEVRALIPMVKALLISELSSLCQHLRESGAYRYSPTDKAGADIEQLNLRAKDNLLMANIFNSLKKVAKLPVSELIDKVSFSDGLLKGEKAAMYDEMYDRTKDDYRERIVRLSRKRRMKEYDLVREVVERADAADHHVGFELFPPKRWEGRARTYVSIVVAATVVLAVLFGSWAAGGWNWMTVLMAVLMMVPLSQLVIDLFGQLLFRLHKPMGTFKIKFKDGLIPQQYATMVIMPTILKNRQKTVEMLEQLEVYYLSNLNRGEGKVSFSPAHERQNIYYTLIGDAAAADTADTAWDDEVEQAGMQKVRELNEKYGAPIFNFVYRRRAYSEGEGCYLGFERKRGAILHFNDLLLGHLDADTRQQYFRCETISNWLSRAKGGVDEGCPITFIITLDTDTELVLYSAQKLIGAMAHPLNRAQLSPDGRRVHAGYGIMQPRVNVDVEVTNKSRYAQLFSGLGGLDVYTTASFELYQDIFNEGSFCGKGIYDLRVFQQVLKGTFPQNLILSHDLLEGCHIRCGLINDVELFDDSPSNYLDDAKRHHRWTRGDWQIISWLGHRVRNERGERVKNQVNTIGRWKIFDNLRRSVLSLSLLVAIFVGYAINLNGSAGLSPAWFVLVAMLVVVSPIVFFIIDKWVHLPRLEKRYHYYTKLLRGLTLVIDKALAQFALIPKEAWMYTDAIVRSCYRMLFSHRNLLNWVPSDEAARSTKGTLGDYIGRFWFNYVCAIAVVLLYIYLPMHNVWVLLSTLGTSLLWVAAPFIMYSLGRKFPQNRKQLKASEQAEVRTLAAETWQYFDRLIVPEHNYLVPDNYQLNRQQRADYKTSPTNIGYSLTAIVSAERLGFITQAEAIERLRHIITTVEGLEKWNGHLFNWYHIDSLKALPNFFISTCDSGNFVACLYVVKGYLEDKGNEEELLARVVTLIRQTDFSRLYNPELDVFSIGYDHSSAQLLPYHYNNFASEARLTSFLTIAQGDAPYKHWFCLDKTLVQYKGYKGVASWYGTLFEYFMPLIFLPTYRHTLMDETYSFAIRAQRSFIESVDTHLPWGISETAYNELDNAQNYKYHAFGVPYLKFQNTTPDRIVISPYSSLMTIGENDRAVYANMQRFDALGMRGEMGFFESYDDEDHTVVQAHYAHHQGMILASLTNYLCDHCLQRYFMSDPAMLSMETLLKEKAQLRPYIDLKVTQYKRYQYNHEQTESDAREYDTLAPVPEVGLLSNGQYTVMLNDRGSGFSRFRSVMLNRYRKVSADHYGTYLFVRNLNTDHLWSATYAPLDVQPERYRVSFASDKIEFQRTDAGIETRTEITVLKDRYAEIRRYTFANTTAQDVDLELTTYAEVILARHEDDEAHRVFNSMRIDSQYDAERDMLVLSKGVEEGSEMARYYVVHRLFLDEESESTEAIAPAEYESSRLKFLGRGGSLRHAEVLESRRTLSGTVGTTLDPIMSMRRRVRVPAGKEVSVYLLQGFSKAYEQLTALSDSLRTALDVDNAFRTASVFNNMRTQMSLLKGQQMHLYNSILKYLLQSTASTSARQALLAENTLSQSSLWRFGISGDLPILLVEVDNLDHSGYAKEMLRAYEYYKVHGLMLDLVFINDEQGDRREGLTHFIRNIANTEHLWSTHEEAGRVYVLIGSELNPAERTLLRTVASLTFTTRDGLRLEEQVQQLQEAGARYQDQTEYPPLQPKANFRVWSSLEYYNQYGGFDRQGRDYVVTNTNTPVPWVNVLAGPHFGCVVSSTMAGFTFASNAQQFKLTAWSNDFVRDPASEMLLIGQHQFLPATARHGQGFSAFDADYDDFKVMVRLFVSTNKPEKYYQLRLINQTPKPLELTLDLLCQFVLGQSEESTARYLHTRWDEASNTLLVRNTYHPTYGNITVGLTATAPLTRFDLSAPNRHRAGLALTLAPNGQADLAFILRVVEADAPQNTYTIPYIEEEFARVEQFWDEKLSTIEVQTPDASFNHMLNRWYLYQVYASRLYARAGFYQVGGATGYRDQLQDVMSLLYTEPSYARRQILDHAAHQFPEGDVLHWWHESLHLGARTTFSDDYLWLPYVVYQYVHLTGDHSILTERISFAQAEPLPVGVAERGVNYTSGTLTTDPTSPTLYEHLRRSIDRARARIGSHGLPLMGCGDWNDGMSHVGVQGRGESTWVALFLIDLLPKMQELTQIMPAADLTYCAELDAFRRSLIKAMQESAWDGNWFLRAYFDNGDPMGSARNTECQIDLISQAWAILTDTATLEQKQRIFRETDARLVDREHEIIRLLTPPFHHSANNPGYIQRYPVGVRENGGQYTHGAMWYIMAQLKEHRTDMAYYLYSIINPIHRTSTLADVLKYKVEPYCIAADIYSNPQHPGRGGWTWYTGSASWAYKTGIENILGLQLTASTLTLCPSIPSEWEQFTLRYRYRSSLYVITYHRGAAVQPITLVDDGEEHRIEFIAQ